MVIVQTFGGSCKARDWCGEMLNSKTDDGTEETEEGATEDTISFPLEDDFEGGGTIPWIFGDPPEWNVDNSESFSGTKSVANIRNTAEGAASTLELKVNVANGGNIACQAKIDTAMPFEMFVVNVNSEKRASYYKWEGKWRQLTWELERGENVIEFRVENNAKFPPFERSINANYGSGHVWLDECAVQAY